MKIDLKFENIDKLIDEMGAERIPWKDNSGLSELEIEQILSKEGLEVEWKDLITEDNGLIYKPGSQIPGIVYIRDCWNDASTIEHSPENGPKFHVAYNCQTLEAMRRRNRFKSRYRFTQNKSGVFVLNAKVDEYSDKRKEVNGEIKVCKNCLKEIDYQDYVSGGIKPQIFTDFSIDEFFAEYSPQFVDKPFYSDKLGPNGEYPKNWNEISRREKQFLNWTCSKTDCKVDLNKLHLKKCLHTHHKDGDVSNVARSNLEVLCIDCHAKEGIHILNMPSNRLSWQLCIEEKKRQGINTKVKTQ